MDYGKNDWLRLGTRGSCKNIAQYWRPIKIDIPLNLFLIFSVEQCGRCFQCYRQVCLELPDLASVFSGLCQKNGPFYCKGIRVIIWLWDFETNLLHLGIFDMILITNWTQTKKGTFSVFIHIEVKMIYIFQKFWKITNNCEV